MSTHYVGKLANGQTITRKSTRNDYTHAAAIGQGGTSSRVPSFGTSAEGARNNFYNSHHKGAPVEVIPVQIVDAATYREALKARR